jgi:ATP-dependent RNA helicase SUPV3L1/SUV3
VTTSRLEDLLEAPHESFELDAAGNIMAGDLTLAQLCRGTSLTQPQVRLAPLEELSAGARHRLQRRLLAFARDVIGRLLEPLEPLRRSDRAPLRAIAYQIERGLGSALRSELAPTLDALSEQDRAALNLTVVRPGRLAIFVPSLLRQAALTRRRTLVRAFEPSVALPPVGRATLSLQGVESSIWLALGYVVVGRRAFRLDLAERVAASFDQGASEQDALECLALPKREWSAATSSFRRALARAPESISPQS